MIRRQFLQGAAAAIFCSATSIPGSAWSSVRERPWRIFEFTTRVDLVAAEDVTRVWLPMPLEGPSPFQRSSQPQVRCAGGTWKLSSDLPKDLLLITAETARNEALTLSVVSRVKVRDWEVDLDEPAHVTPLPSAVRRACLAPTEQVPTDGLVRSRALDITRGAETDEAKARALYEWIVSNAYRKPSVRGCGRGSILPLLETGDLGGKCADLSALFVGLARAAGLPAREAYGIRLAPSRLGYTSLGPSTSLVSRAQHCRAEVWLERFGWVPVDPADVLKVALEEAPGHLGSSDSKVASARQRFFGSWEMNWLAFNYAQDIHLPGSQGPSLPFSMYPQAENARGRLDSLNPDTFRYEIHAVEVG